MASRSLGALVLCAVLAIGSPVRPQIITTWAGTGTSGFDGDGHHRLASQLSFPQDITFAPSGVYVLDWNNHAVREVMPSGVLQTVVGTTPSLGDGAALDADRTPPGAPGTTVALNHPTHLAPLSNGLLLLSCWQNSKLRTYDPATGLVLVVCGDDRGFAGDGGPALDAQLALPSVTIQDADGFIYVLDQANQRVRRIDDVGNITTVVGTGVAGFSGDGGAPANAQISMPSGQAPFPAGGLALDDQGRLYVADTANHRIRRIDFDANVIETFAGNGTATLAGDGGPAIDASLNTPHDIEFGPDGRLYVADQLNSVVRAIDLATGVITTVAGTGTAGFGGDGGPALQADLNRPAGIAFDPAGRMYIADTFNHRIRVVGDDVVTTGVDSWGGLKSRFRH